MLSETQDKTQIKEINTAPIMDMEMKEMSEMVKLVRDRSAIVKGIEGITIQHTGLFGRKNRLPSQLGRKNRLSINVGPNGLINLLIALRRR